MTCSCIFASVETKNQVFGVLQLSLAASPDTTEISEGAPGEYFVDAVREIIVITYEIARYDSKIQIVIQSHLYFVAVLPRVASGYCV